MHRVGTARAAVAATLLLVLLTAAVELADELPGEGEVLEAVRARHDAARDVALAVDAATEVPALAAVAVALVLLLVVVGRRGAAARTGAAVLLALLVNPVLKRLVERPRPQLMLVPPAEVSAFSFPSGHAAGTAVLAVSVVLAGLGTRRRWPVLVAALALVAATAWAELALGVHRPSDLAAGWLVGVISAGAVWSVRRPGRRARQGSNLRPSA